MSCSSALPRTFSGQACVFTVGRFGARISQTCVALDKQRRARVESSALYPATAGAAECRYWWEGLTGPLGVVEWACAVSPLLGQQQNSRISRGGLEGPSRRKRILPEDSKPQQVW